MTAAARVLVTGADGQVGKALLALPHPHGLEIIGLNRSGLDITHAEEVATALHAQRADIVVNLAAYTAVDRAENERASAMAVNRDGTAYLARACRRRGIPMIHISTDYVFDGTRDSAWRPDDPINPINIYGESKALGEIELRHALPAHVILRASWVFGVHGNNFVRTMLAQIGRRAELCVVDDQRGCPTAAVDLASVILVVAQRLVDEHELAGTYHYCNDGVTTWCRFAEAIFAVAKESGQAVPRVVPITTAEYPTAAKRPANSELDCTKTIATFGVARPPWRESLKPVMGMLLRGLR